MLTKDSHKFNTMKEITLFIFINIFITLTVNAVPPSNPYFIVEKYQTIRMAY